MIKKLREETIIRLNDNATLTPRDTDEVMQHHLILFGEGKLKTRDRYELTYYINRVKAYYKNNKGIRKAAADYKKYLKKHPTRRVSELTIDSTNITLIEKIQVKNKYQKLYGRKENYNYNRNEDLRLMIDRITKLEQGDFFALKLQKDLK